MGPAYGAMNGGLRPERPELPNGVDPRPVVPEGSADRGPRLMEAVSEVSGTGLQPGQRTRQEAEAGGGSGTAERPFLSPESIRGQAADEGLYGPPGDRTPEPELPHGATRAWNVQVMYGTGGEGPSVVRWETPERRSHQPAPETIDDWLRNQAIATTWACGMSIQALVEKSGYPAVIWKWKDNTWQRYTFSAKFKDGQAMVCRQGHPLVLILREGHFTFMTPPAKDREAPFPKPWLKQGPKFNEIIDLTGEPRLTAKSQVPDGYSDAADEGNTRLTCEALQQHDKPTASGAKSLRCKPALKPHKIKKRKARKDELAQKQFLKDWTAWPCPLCHQEIQIKGCNYGQAYRKKHLAAAHGASLKDHPLPGRKNMTLRAQLRVNQSSKQHQLVHVHHHGLQDCVNQGDTWICKVCLCKGCSGKVAAYECRPMHDTKRAAWWHRLQRSQRNKLAAALEISSERVREISKWARTALARSKPKPENRSEADLRYRMQLKRRRAQWRKENGLCADARQAPGHCNLSATLNVPIQNLGKRKRHQTE
ncbi:NRT2.5 [Symbiodinium sp. CCMP2592]|nr:NRT2.5 [Symbiodinium sp. CCMP2592]